MPFLRSPSKITVLLICPVALLLFAVGAIFWRGLSSAGAHFAAIATLEAGYEVSRQLTDAAIAVASERRELFTLLSDTDVPASRPPDERKRTDTLMTDLLSRNDPEMNILAGQYHALKEARTAADAALEAPLSQRDASVREEWIRSTDALLREAERIMRRIAFIPGDETGKFASFALLRLRILQFRITLENTSSRVVRLLIRSDANRADEIPALRRLRGGESVVWENARALAPFADSVSLDRHVSSADRYYAETLSPVLDTILRSPDHGVSPEIYRGTIAPLLRLTETCLRELDDAMRRNLETLRAAIRAGITREKGLFAGTFLFALSLCLLFVYRVARPLDLIHGIVTDLQAGNLDAPFPKARHDDEIGTLAETLERFRQTLQERTRIVRALEASEERLSLAMNAANDGLFDWTPANDSFFFSPRLFTMLGYAPDELPHELDTWKRLVHPDDLPAAYERYLLNLNDREPYIAELRMRTREGGWKWILVRADIVERSEAGKPARIVGTHIDITERKEMEQKLRDLATTDELTALANRRQFLETGAKETERSRRNGSPLSLLMLDLDNFKDVNDRYGHPTGDATLRLFSATCAKTLRVTDIFGRLGGEEFAILLPDTTAESAVVLAERLRADIGRTDFPSDEGSFSITVSIGIASMNAPADSLSDLMHRADRALYESKRTGRNRVTVA